MVTNFEDSLLLKDRLHQKNNSSLLLNLCALILILWYNVYYLGLVVCIKKPRRLVKNWKKKWAETVMWMLDNYLLGTSHSHSIQCFKVDSFENSLLKKDLDQEWWTIIHWWCFEFLLVEKAYVSFERLFRVSRLGT